MPLKDVQVQTVQVKTSSAVDKGGLECPWCHDLFTQPKILPCGHLTCRDCLAKRIRQKPETHCPYCHCPILQPAEKVGGGGESAVDRLPTDMAMESLVDSARKLGNPQRCRACVKVSANCICLTCGDPVCMDCASRHANMSATKTHSVKKLSDLTPEQLSASRSLPCATHKTETCRLWCPTHGVPICQMCVGDKERTCKEVTDLQDTLKEVRDRLSDLEVVLSGGEKDLTKSMSELDQYLVNNERNKRTALADVDATCDRLQFFVNECRRRMKDLVLAANCNVAAAVGGANAVLASRRLRLTTHKRVVQRTRTTAPPMALLTMSPLLRSRVLSLDRGSLLPDSAKVITKATFDIEKDAIIRIEKELEELGQVTVVCAPVDAQPQPVGLRFHPNTGRHVTLSNGWQTAERSGDWEYGLVVSCEQMVVNWLYEVRIEEVDKSYSPSGKVFTGVITENPATHASSRVHDAWYLNSAFVIWDSVVQSMGVQRKSRVGAALTKLRVGGRVGVLLDAARCLHLYVNGADQGVAARDVPQPCFAFFDLGFYWKKVTALHVLPIKTG